MGNNPSSYIQMHTYYLDQIANRLNERVFFSALLFHISLNMVVVWQEAEGKLFCDATRKLFTILPGFCVQLNMQKMS